ncbi:Por secretion system C-terminal sorting domain-containing protein [Aquimarina amphilecti]|uniref:cellulase n=1 Tax=Aquimarina amphilecti TaxID=1038014 RepID=A0A1H7T6S9_AQUAM|nr:cellulase family glycosylhydrolase [Aquimarina amphilecti]SEL80438.1 Por secretion system C-terminal sorting domain-containing protein [Aquimarina amphilecti]
MKRFINYMMILLLFFGSISEIIAQQQNFLTVSGNKLYDTTGKEVRLTGVNWFGFETQNYSPHGIWSRDMKSVLQQIKDLGFNTIRVPWCNEMLNPSSTIAINSYGTDPYSGVSPMNEEETTVSKPIELLDIFVKWCQENDMKIVLDNHSRAADGFLNEAVWYTPEYSEERWINDWVFIADRYKNYSAVVAMDLNNEPHGSTWGDSNPATDWNKAAERCGNAVLQANPNVLIIIEGVGEFEGNSYWWGGQLMGAKKYPVQLSDPSKLMYSAHEYGPEVSQQDWFTASDFPQNMPGLWTDNFHYLYEEGTSPLFLGEFGIKDQDAFGGISYTWFTEFTDFMGDIYSWTFWSMNPNSGDTGGILQDDWTNVNQWKLDVLTPHLAPFIPNVVGGTGNLPPTAKFSSDIDSGNAPLTVQFDASESSDPDGDNLSYSWSFGDGSTATGVGISHLFTQPGTYQVSLTVSDGSLSHTSNKTITVVDDTVPTVTANLVTDNNSGVAPSIINFDATGSTSSDGSTLVYSWDFGDGTAGSGVTINHEFVDVGSYDVVLTVSNADGISDTAITTIIITEPNTGGDCSFGAPLSNPLPTISNASYNNMYVLGSGGPDLSNVTNFTINWDLQNSGLWQLSMNTNNGVPNWWNDLKSNITIQTFNTAQPSITITGTGFPNLDGAYYATIDGDNFALVSKSGAFTIYFSNSNAAPNCQEQLKDPIVDSEIRIKTYPNPVANKLIISQDNSFNNAQMKIVDISGKVIKTFSTITDTNMIELNVSELKAGVYFIKIFDQKNTVTKQIIKQ